MTVGIIKKEFRIRPSRKKTRFFVDNEILEVYSKKLKPQGIAVYCALARFANFTTQACFPSYPKLMQVTGIGNRNTLNKYLDRLEQLGLISVTRNKKRKPNLYYLLEINSSSIKKTLIQYQNSNLDSIESDTLNNITKSYKEENISQKKNSDFMNALRREKQDVERTIGINH